VGGAQFFCCAPPLLDSANTISRFGERFRDGQCSLVSFLFAVILLSQCPHAQTLVKVGARAPVESAPLADVGLFKYKIAT